MRSLWVLALIDSAIAIDTYAAVAVKANCTGVGCAGYYRAFAVVTSPASSGFEPTSNVTGVSIAALGAQASPSGAIIQARLDVAGFRFKTPADTSDGNQALSFYFGYLGASGTWNPSTKTANVVGALAEVISTFSSVNVWYDNDGVAGFKWDIMQPDPKKRWDIFNNADGEINRYDTLDAKGSLDLKSLTWTPIDHSKIKCNNITSLSTAPDDCEIHSLTTIGAESSAPTVPVITFTARIASQPVLINGVLHGPELAKFDVRVQFPWASFTSLYAPTKAKLAIFAFNAGKSGAFVGNAKRTSDGVDSLVWGTDGSSQTSHYSYTATAQIDGQTGPITTQVITGQQILDFTCPAGSPCAGLLSGTNWVALVLKAGVNWLQGFKWKSSLTIHALGTTTQPLNVFWDPEVGSSSVYTNTNTNSAGLVAPSVLLLAALFCH